MDKDWNKLTKEVSFTSYCICKLGILIVKTQLKLANVQKTSSNMSSIITFIVSLYGLGILTAIVKTSLVICFAYHLISF